MSGPHDRPDDPDEVTLWAGRLRAWPTPPAAAEDSPAEFDDDTVRVRAADPDADTVLSRRARAADDTVVSTADDDEIGATAPRGASIPAERAPAIDDETIRRPAPAVADDLDDETIRRPARAAAPDLDEETIRRAVPPADLADDTVRGPSAEPPGVDDDTRPRAAPPGVDDDTAAGSRRSRREAAAGPTPADGPMPPVVSREARVPAALHRDTYAPRADAPVRVERTLPAPRPSAPDASAVRPRSARRGTVLAVVLAVVVVVIVAAAAVGALLLVG